MDNIDIQINGSGIVFTTNGQKTVIKSKYVEVGKINTHYIDAGKGKTILVLPGFPGPWSAYIQLIAKLSQNYHVIVLNLPGLPGGTESFQSEHKSLLYPDFISKFLEATGIKTDYLLGISFGGVVGLLYAKKYPGSFKKIIVQSPPAEGLMVHPFYKLCYILFKSCLNHKRLVKPALKIIKYFYLKFGIKFTIKNNGLEKVNKNIKDLVLNDMHKLDEFALAELAVDIVESDFSNDLKDLGTPCLVVTGSKDQSVPVKMTKNLAESVLENSKFLCLDGKNHWFPVLEPKLFGDIIHGFFS